MMQDIAWMEGILKEAVLLWNSRRGHHVLLEDLVIIWVGVLLLVLGAVLIVELMATGLEIAKLGTGRINAIDVGKGAI